MNKAAATRQTILQQAFELSYVNGYQTTSIDTIIATTQVTKGAFYYHFKNKEEMGIAIIREILRPTLTSTFKKLLEANGSPLDAIYSLMHHLLLENDFLQAAYGCPVANLAGEMAPWNEAFRQSIDELTQEWITMMTRLIKRGKSAGYVRGDVHAGQAAMFIVSGYWGIRSFGKLGNSKKVYLPFLKELRNYLSSLQ